jgi:hypothetical protein
MRGRKWRIGCRPRLKRPTSGSAKAANSLQINHLCPNSWTSHWPISYFPRA